MTEAVYNIYGAHRELFKSRDDEVLLCGPAGTGKSFAAILKAHLYCLRNPGVRVLFVRKTLASLTNTGVVTYKEQIAKDVIANGDVIWFGGSPQESPSFKYSNGSAIILGGMDNAGKVMSAEYDLVYVQEATDLTENDWESLTTRIRNNKSNLQQLMADCNPQTPTHWLKVRADKGLVKLINTTHKDNPSLYNPETGEITVEGEKYLGRLSKLTGVRKERLLYGRWAAAEGLIYEDFDPAVHVLSSDFKIPTHWHRFWSIDFGFNNPFVCQFWAEDEDGRLYLYKEVYKSRRIVEDHARYIMAKCKSKETGGWLVPRPRAIVGDHDAEGRATFTRHTGLAIAPAKKDVVVGIQETQSRFKIQEDGKPRIFFLENAVFERDEVLAEAGKPCSTLEEITGYVWDTASSRGFDKNAKETPLKENDHGMDAMRYVCMKRSANRNRTRFTIVSY